MEDSVHQFAHSLSQEPQMDSSSWQFVTISPLGERSESTRRRIRSHASRHHHQQTRALKAQGRRMIRQDEIELDATPLLLRSTSILDSLLPESIGGASEVSSDQLTISQPGFGRVDPFFKPPFQMNYSEYELCDHLFDQSCVMFLTMQNIGFLAIARMTVAFRQLLAMSSWHLRHLNQNRRSDEYLKLSLSATQELQKQINHPLNCCSDDAIIAVLTFLCCANLTHDTAAFTIHRNGLRLMLNLRGGIQTLDTSPGLRTMLYWADVNGSCLQDIPPLFPAPIHLLGDATKEGFNLLTLQNEANTTTITGNILSTIQRLHKRVNIELHRRDVWKDPVFQGMEIIPILGQLQTLGSVYAQGANRNPTIVEAFRLAAILHLSALRAGFGVDTAHLEPVYARKLESIVVSQRLSHDVPSAELNWILATAYTAKCHIYQKSFFRTALLDHLKGSGASDYAWFQEKLESIAWDKNLLPNQTQDLKDLFSSNI